MKITISGTIGAGKTTVAKKLAKMLGYKFYSTGRMMRDMAEKNDMSLNELSKIAIEDVSIDKEIDDYQKNIGQKQDNFVMEGRLGFFFIPDSIRLFLKTSIENGARRIYDEKRNDELFKSFSDAKKAVSEREAAEAERYEKLYKIDYRNEGNYDLVIDTSQLDSDQIVALIITFLRKMHMLTEKENNAIENNLLCKEK